MDEKKGWFMSTRLPFPLLLLFATTALFAAPIELLPRAEVLAVDRAELRLQVKILPAGEVRVLQITSETRFILDGKYAVSEAVQPGDTVTGKVHKRADGTYEAVRLVITKAKAPAIALAE
jgi:hypothetical protein